MKQIQLLICIVYFDRIYHIYFISVHIYIYIYIYMDTYKYIYHLVMQTSCSPLTLIRSHLSEHPYIFRVVDTNHNGMSHKGRE